MEHESKIITLERIIKPDDTKLDEVYALFCNEFPADEMDELEVFREELGLTAAGEHEAPYYLFAAVLDDQIVGSIGGNYLPINLFLFPRLAAGAIGYCAVRKNFRYMGIGNKLVNQFEAQLRSCAANDGRVLHSLVLEAQSPSKEKPNLYDSRPFWVRLGWQIIKEAYKQPPMQFDKYTGKPTSDAVSLTFMVKTLDGSSFVPVPLFNEIITFLFRQWYAPEKDDFVNERAYQRANKYVDEILHNFLNSVQQINQDIIQLKG